MSLREVPTSPRVTANRLNALKSTGPRTEPGRLRVTGNLRCNLSRLLGVPEAVLLGQEPGAAIHRRYELISLIKSCAPLTLLKVLGLAEKNKPTHRNGPHRTSRSINRRTTNVAWNQRDVAYCERRCEN